MSVTRRQFLVGASVAAAAMAVTRPVFGQGWAPSRDVEFVVLSGVGGGSDLMARIIAKVITDEKLTPTPLLVNNRPGGGGAVGVGYVAANRGKDPHTLVLMNATTQITPILTPNARTMEALQPVMNFMLDDFLLFVKGDSPYKTAQDFVKDAKAKPDKAINFGTAGTTDVMAITLLSRALGREINAVNFNSGGEVLTALLGGHIDAAINNPQEFIGHLDAGTVRALGVFRDDRFPAFPDVPTMKEVGVDTPKFQMWRGVALPKDIEPAALEYWTGILRKVAASPALKKYIAENFATEAPLSGMEFEAFLAGQEKLYRDLLGKPA